MLECDELADQFKVKYDDGLDGRIFVMLRLRNKRVYKLKILHLVCSA